MFYAFIAVIRGLVIISLDLDARTALFHYLFQPTIQRSSRQLEGHVIWRQSMQCVTLTNLPKL
ncbi:hypothetical protein WS67_11305 [Burkholderia singularis]|uniref:Uncharacterized protein n=1 Tax=Burkholderia singularis TaxID=1503053 RepID=A0A103E351_9BURK|nr:hypothetical protein WS67_11305 [Burkholderia singularis]